MSSIFAVAPLGACTAPNLSSPTVTAVTVGTAGCAVSDESAAESWTEAEIRRFSIRVPMFMRRGMDELRAEHLAELLVTRDRDMDTRRHCVECKHLQQDGGCFKAQQGCVPGVPTYYKPMQILLQRCDNFEWLAPKTTARRSH